MQLAEDLAARVAAIKKGNEKAGDSHLLVLAGLVLSNDVRDLKRELQALREEMTEAGRSREALSDRVNEIEEVLSEALNAAAKKIEATLPPEPDPTAETNA